jgi:hypothetical protein
MKVWIFSLALLILTPLAATAQAPAPPDGDMQIERKQRRAIVLPKPHPDEVRADANRALDDYVGRSTGNVVKETSPVRPSPRPNLDSDISRGIQSDRVNRELRR